MVDNTNPSQSVGGAIAATPPVPNTSASSTAAPSRTSSLSNAKKIVFNGLAFQTYTRNTKPPADGPDYSHVANNTQRMASPIKALTSNLTETYRHCNPQFLYASTLNPKRVLTHPSDGVANQGYDNNNSDYIIYVNDVIGTAQGHRYQVLDLLGQGTFGQVVKCKKLPDDTDTYPVEEGAEELVAIKILKNRPAYLNQGLLEVRVLEHISQRGQEPGKGHTVRLLDYFIFRRHLCLVFELLSVNLYELVKQNQFRGLSTNLIRVFMVQILDSLIMLSQASVIHCDLKPENILLQSLNSPRIKLIDFGSACFENQTVYSYIQSRHYRSPEVLFGQTYSSSIDVWSLGCIAAELFLGLPLFPGSSEFNQVCRIVEMLGLPPDEVLDRGRSSSRFFKPARSDSPGTPGPRYQLKTEAEYERENNVTLPPHKKYFNYITLDDIVMNYAFKKNASIQEIDRERAVRRSFCNFVYGLLHLDSTKRWTPQQARGHPFITGDPYTEPYVPPPGLSHAHMQSPRGVISPPGHPSPVSIPIPVPGPMQPNPSMGMAMAMGMQMPGRPPGVGDLVPASAAAMVGSPYGLPSPAGQQHGWGHRRPNMQPEIGGFSPRGALPSHLLPSASGLALGQSPGNQNVPFAPYQHSESSPSLGDANDGGQRFRARSKSDTKAHPPGINLSGLAGGGRNSPATGAGDRPPMYPNSSGNAQNAASGTQLSPRRRSGGMQPPSPNLSSTSGYDVYGMTSPRGPDPSTSQRHPHANNRGQQQQTRPPAEDPSWQAQQGRTRSRSFTDQQQLPQGQYVGYPPQLQLHPSPHGGSQYYPYQQQQQQQQQHAYSYQYPSQQPFVNGQSPHNGGYVPYSSGGMYAGPNPAGLMQSPSNAPMSQPSPDNQRFFSPSPSSSAGDPSEDEQLIFGFEEGAPTTSPPKLAPMSAPSSLTTSYPVPPLSSDATVQITAKENAAITHPGSTPYSSVRYSQGNVPPPGAWASSAAPYYSSSVPDPSILGLSPYAPPMLGRVAFPLSPPQGQAPTHTHMQPHPQMQQPTQGQGYPNTPTKPASSSGHTGRQRHGTAPSKLSQSPKHISSPPGSGPSQPTAAHSSSLRTPPRPPAHPLVSPVQTHQGQFHPTNFLTSPAQTGATMPPHSVTNPKNIPVIPKANSFLGPSSAPNTPQFSTSSTPYVPLSMMSPSGMNPYATPFQVGVSPSAGPGFKPKAQVRPSGSSGAPSQGLVDANTSGVRLPTKTDAKGALPVPLSYIPPELGSIPQPSPAAHPHDWVTSGAPFVPSGAAPQGVENIATVIEDYNPDIAEDNHPANKGPHPRRGVVIGRSRDAVSSGLPPARQGGSDAQTDEPG
eukprot:TRINITY_DN9546_c0_g1_i1.p1 TRINITY_DN9546_c0_g1~~TRINITY_DN9546_c0_g1_i1.p1  ORF type:complete len:1341 (+),score=265.13 TRINITY_DN9546_c0_g1_i1:268-4290(+)